MRKFSCITMDKKEYEIVGSIDNENQIVIDCDASKFEDLYCLFYRSESINMLTRNAQQVANIYLTLDNDNFIYIEEFLYKIKGNPKDPFSSIVGTYGHYLLDNSSTDLLHLQCTQLIYKMEVDYNTFILFPFTNKLNLENYIFELTSLQESDRYFIQLSLKSRKKVDFYDIKFSLECIHDLISLAIGNSLYLDSITIKNESENIKLFMDLSDSYKRDKVSFKHSSIIGVPELFKSGIPFDKYMNAKKKSGVIFHMLLWALNHSTYTDVKCSILVQVADGYTKSIGNVGDRNNVHKTIARLFGQIKVIDMLSELDKTLVTRENKSGTESLFLFMSKAEEHRHYFSHYNVMDYDDVLNSSEAYYIFQKLMLAIRIHLFEFLDYPLNSTLAANLLKGIDSFAEYNQVFK